MSPKAEIVEQLIDAMESRSLVRIRRSPRNADRVKGFPVAIGTKWVLFAETGDGGFFDGQTAVRLKDIARVKRDSSFEERFAWTQPEWPPTAPAGIDLNSTSGLIKGVSQVSPLIGVEQEGRHASRMKWIGVVDEIGKGWLWLHEVRPDASWHKRPLGYRLRRITKVAILDRYLIALSDIAGTSPGGRGRQVFVSGWCSVRCVFRHNFDGQQVYEERVTLWQTPDLDAALARAEGEAHEYAGDQDVEYTGLAQGYHLADPARDASEVFSLMRVSELGPDAYLDRYFQTGAERERGTE